MLIPLAILALLFAIWFVAQYNSFVAMKNQIEKAKSDIDVLLKQRRDELSKLVDSVKGYMKYEKEVMEKVTKLRSNFEKAKTLEERLKASDQLTSIVPSLIAVVEKYPELKANENVNHLMERVTGLENEIADRREYYNQMVLSYNNALKMFPSSIVAKFMNLKPEKMFKAGEGERKDVKISI